MIRQCERDRARAAVEVEHHLLPREARKFDGFRVEPLGLSAVDLIKRRHTQPERLAAERILKPVAPPERAVAVAKDDVALFRVRAEHDAGALRACIAQERDKPVFFRQFISVHEHADKALPRRVRANVEMADKAAARLFVIARDAAGLHIFAQRLRRGIGLGLDQ